MTQLVRNQKPLFNENLFSVKSLFDSNSITVCDSPRAYGFVDNNSKTSKSFAFYIEGYFAPADNNYNWDLGDSLDYTAEKTGNYVFQFNLFIENFADLSESSSKIIVYLVKNGVFTSFERNITDLIDIDLITDNIEVNIWQSFNANAGDLIQFGFRLEKVTTSTGIPVLVGDHYFSAFKLELIKGDEEISPTPYTLPIGYNTDTDVIAEELSKVTGWASYVDNDYTLESPFVLDSASGDVLLINRAKSIIDIQKPLDIKNFYAPTVLTVGAITGVFLEGEVITGSTSGATGTLKEVLGTKFRITNLTGSFAVSETITGATSGAITTVVSKKNAVITGRVGDGLSIMIYFKALPSTTNTELELWIDIGGAIGQLYKETRYFRGATEKGVLYTVPAGYTLDTWEANGGQVYVKAIGGNFNIHSMNFNFVRTHKAR